VKILIIAGFADSIIKFRGDLILRLLEQGFEVHVACPHINATSDVLAGLHKMSVKTHQIPLDRAGLNPLGDILTLIALIFLINRVKPSHVLSYTIKPVIYGSFASWINRVPNRFAMITGLGNAFVANRKSSFVGWLIKFLYKRAMFCLHLLFLQNPDDKKILNTQNIIPFKLQAVVVNGSGVNLDSFPLVPPVQSPIKFLFIARLLGDKGIRQFVEAAYRLRAMVSVVEFHVVGWIDDNSDSITPAELEQWCKDGVINYHGRLSDVRPVLADSSVFVLPSFYPEGTPRTILEALSMGRPVITTDMPGCRETVVDGENGYLIEARDSESLLKAMLQFIENPGLISSMGQCSREIAERKYDVHKVNEQMLFSMGLIK